MELIDKLYNSCVLMSRKATKGMNALIEKHYKNPKRRNKKFKTLSPNPNGIISKTDIEVTKSGSVIELKTHFPEYAWFANYGRNAGKPSPVQPIRDWCYVHNIPVGAAYAIAKNIGKYGTDGMHFIEPLQRMLEMLTKTMRQTAVVEMQASYYSVDSKTHEGEYSIYDGVKTLKDMKLVL